MDTTHQPARPLGFSAFSQPPSYNSAMNYNQAETARNGYSPVTVYPNSGTSQTPSIFNAPVPINAAPSHFHPASSLRPGGATAFPPSSDSSGPLLCPPSDGSQIPAVFNSRIPINAAPTNFRPKKQPRSRLCRILSPIIGIISLVLIITFCYFVGTGIYNTVTGKNKKD